VRQSSTHNLQTNCIYRLQTAFTVGLPALLGDIPSVWTRADGDDDRVGMYMHAAGTEWCRVRMQRRGWQPMYTSLWRDIHVTKEDEAVRDFGEDHWYWRHFTFPDSPTAWRQLEQARLNVGIEQLRSPYTRQQYCCINGLNRQWRLLWLNKLIRDGQWQARELPTYDSGRRKSHKWTMASPGFGVKGHETEMLKTSGGVENLFLK